MPLESASYISELVATNPTASDPKSQGDNQLRLLKSVLQTQFPNFGTNAITATAAELNYSVGVTSGIQGQLNAITTNYAPLLSPSFTGVPTAPTPSAGDSSTAIATTAFVAGLAFSSALPGQTGNAGKFVTTDGTTASWVAIDLVPKVLQRTITGADTLIASDQGKLINCSGTFTLAVTAAATLGNGWWCYVRDTGTGVVTLDPNGSETVDGVTSGQVRDTILLACNGTSFTAVKIGPFSVIDVLTSGTSWTAPLGVRRASVRGIGGGGGGGRGAGDSPTDIACGGSGAGTFDATLVLTPGTAYTYSIGAAGTAAATGNTAGNAGGATTLTVNGTTYTANGGNGGPIASNSLIDGGTAVNGRVNTQGGQGLAFGASPAYFSFGGDSTLGVGGNRVSSSTSASSGYGSGGRGGLNSVVAGDGRPGVLILEY